MKIVGQEITVSCMENQCQTNELKRGGVYWEKTVPDGG